MRALVLDHPGSFRVAEVPDPTPEATQIVVRVECCGICGTDLHILAGEFPPTPYPITPGHEFAGTVVARGADVKPDLPIGARVIVLRAALTAAGWVIEHSEAGLYLWAARPGSDGWESARTLAEAGILVSPGELYGAAGTPYIRMALTATDERVAAAAARLTALA